MGFLAGRVTCGRYRIVGKSPRMFGPEHLAKLAAHAIGKQRVAAADGVEVGWTAGDHILDLNFELAKNVVNDALQFALRIDSLKMPADLLRAYTAVELTALAANNPSGIPSARQKREARTAARERLEAEASDGRFLRRKAYPVMWDIQSGELLIGTTAVTVVDRLHTLFQQTFGLSFEPLNAGRQAFLQAEARQQSRGVDDAKPSPFLPSQTVSALAWQPDEASRDFLGNEFLLWLWHLLDTETDTLRVADKSEVAVMFARSLVLECPRGQTGRESISSDAPTRLPEARRAVQAGKLPRKAGLTIVRHDHQYELTLQAESLAISGAKLPQPEEDEERARLEERVTLLRHMLETLDLLYDAFGKRRAGSEWSKDLAKMQKWLTVEERRRSATA
jgi:hypothetical protein